MFRGCLILAAVFAATITTASEPQQITVWKLDAGYYVVSGSQIVAFPPSGPVVPPDPTPTPEGLTKAIVAAVNAVQPSDKRHTAAMKLTATYQMLAGQIKDGKIAPANAVAAAELICQIALGADGKQAPWPGVFSVVNATVGKAGTAEATAKVFDEAATATLSTVPASGDLEATAERYGFDWASFLAFLMELLKILLPLIIS